MRHADCSLWNSLPEDLGAAESALHIHVSLTFVRILRVVHRPYLIYSLILLYIVKSFTFFFYLMCHPFYCLFLFHFVCFSPAFFLSNLTYILCHSITVGFCLLIGLSVICEAL